MSFKYHAARGGDFRDLREAKWDHWELPFARSRALLDGFLGLSSLTPWDYRKGLGYLLRSQRDYQDVCQLNKYVAHADWKPYVAHVLGLESAEIAEYYEVEDEVKDLRQEVDRLVAEVGGLSVTQAKVDNLLLLKNDEIGRRSKVLESFDFSDAESAVTDRLVREVDAEIAELNERRYSMRYDARRLRSALEVDTVRFDPEAIAELFQEMTVSFEGQLRKDFDQLVDFNREITAERSKYLVEELAQVEAKLAPVSEELKSLNSRRAGMLSFLGESDAFQAFRDLTDELVALKADALSLTRQRDQLSAIADVETKVAVGKEKLRALEGVIRKDIDTKSASDYDGIYNSIRLEFSRIVRAVLDRDALLTVELNGHHHPEFRAEILDAGGATTSADLGVTYRKLLCVAFDLAVLRAHMADRYPRFVYHDGIFEGSDPRKKERLMEVIREYSDSGIQHIITLLDSDAPESDDESLELSPTDIVLRLHDEGDEGRLFKMREF